MRLVRCLSTGQFLALKALKKVDLVRMNQLRHIANEKDILASIHHPFIVDLCADNNSVASKIAQPVFIDYPCAEDFVASYPLSLSKDIARVCPFGVCQARITEG